MRKVYISVNCTRFNGINLDPICDINMLKLNKITLLVFLCVISSCGKENEPRKETEAASEAVRLAPFTLCDDIAPLFRSANDPKAATALLKEKYVLVKELAGANSGAKVFIVSPKTAPEVKLILKTMWPSKDPEVKLILKTLWPSKETNFERSENYREAYFSCTNASLKTHEYLPVGMNAGEFFPRLYDVGVVDSLDPLGKGERSDKGAVPFLVMEFVEGMSFIDFVEQPQKAQALYGFNLENAPKEFLKGVLLQLNLALLNADKATGFRHNDLHPGNIMISTKFLDFKFPIGLSPVELHVPLIKIIDFGSGYDRKYTDGADITHKPLKERERRLLRHEIKDIAARQFFKSQLLLRLVPYMGERDIRSINFYMQAFKNRLKKLGAHQNDNLCDTYTECLHALSNL